MPEVHGVLLEKVAKAIQTTLESQPFADNDVPGRTERDQYIEMAHAALSNSGWVEMRDALDSTCKLLIDLSSNPKLFPEGTAAPEFTSALKKAQDALAFARGDS